MSQVNSRGKAKQATSEDREPYGTDGTSGKSVTNLKEPYIKILNVYVSITEFL